MPCAQVVLLQWLDMTSHDPTQIIHRYLRHHHHDDHHHNHHHHDQANELTAAMFSVYKATGAHWSKRRRLVCCIGSMMMMMIISLMMMKMMMMMMRKMMMITTIQVDERYASIAAPDWTQRSEKSEHLVGDQLIIFLIDHLLYDHYIDNHHIDNNHIDNHIDQRLRDQRRVNTWWEINESSFQLIIF